MTYTQVVEHVAVATRTSSGVGPALYVGSFRSGQLVLRVLSLAGAGAFVRPRWEASADGSAFGLLLAGSTATATGVFVYRMADALGAWGRCRWTQSATGLKFGVSFVLSG